MKLNLLKPLKRIFTALSGEETEDKNLVSVMDKIADVVEESGSSSSGGGGLIVNQTEELMLDRTFGEIFEAFSSGTPVIIRLKVNDSTYFCPVILCNKYIVSDSEQYRSVGIINYSTTAIQKITYYANSDSDYPVQSIDG